MATANQHALRFLSVGEVVWDVFDSTEHLGGAPLNLAYHLARLGHHSAIFTAVSEDSRGRQALAIASSGGIDTRFVQITPEAPTGVVRVSLAANGLPTYLLEHPAAYDYAILSPPELQAIAAWQPAWICYGTLFHHPPDVLASTERLFAACPAARRFYDINLRPKTYSPELVACLAAAANILKVSEEEAPEVARLLGEPYLDRVDFVRRLQSRFHYDAVCLTRGADGCALLWASEYLECPAEPIVVIDTVGAGDAFSAAILHAWTANWPARQAATFANRVGALVASRPGATPVWSEKDIAG